MRGPTPEKPTADGEFRYKLPPDWPAEVADRAAADG